MKKSVVVVFAAVLALSPLHSQAQENASVQSPIKQQDIDHLKRQIQQDSRSSAEAIMDYHTETGDLNNRLDFFRYGGRLNLKTGASSTFQFTGTRTDYMPISSLYDQHSMNATAGFQTKLAESVDAQFEGGATRFSTDSTTFNGLASVTYNYSDRTHVYGTFSRTNVEDSLLSATGVRPDLGPFSGQLIGNVMENRFAGGGSIPLVAGFDLFGEGGVGTRVGSNVPSNFFKSVDVGTGYNIISRSDNSSLTLLRAMYELNYFGFDSNRSGFGGASFLTRSGLVIPPTRVGSDVLPTVETGGYFSPQSFVSNTARIQARGGSDDRLSYSVTGFIGAQNYTDVSTRWATGVSGTVNIGITDRFYVPVTYAIDNFGPFTQQSFFARLGIRF